MKMPKSQHRNQPLPYCSRREGEQQETQRKLNKLLIAILLANMATPTENVAIVGKGDFAAPLELFSMFTSSVMNQVSVPCAFVISPLRWGR